MIGMMLWMDGYEMPDMGMIHTLVVWNFASVNDVALELVDSILIR
jgi:hypothetical protein